MSERPKIVGRVLTRQTTPAHGDVGLCPSVVSQSNQEAANPTYGGWPTTPLGKLTKNFDSVRVPVKGADRKSGKYPYYGASGIVDHVDGFLFDGEYLLIAEDGENLRTRQTPVAFMATGKFWVNNHAHIVQGNDRALTRYLSYALSQTEISGFLSGSTMPKLTQGNMNRIPVIEPPLPEQKTIAHILGTLDDKIELNRRMNATLEAMARALFQSWFVDFDPVRAKLDGRKPAGLDAATAALFPAHFQESPLGHIPQGWEVCPLANKIELLSGGTPKTAEPDYWDGDIPWFSVKDAPTETDVWVTYTEKSVTMLGIANSAAQVFPEKTTIISARGTVGKLALTGTPMAMNQSCYGVRGITGYGDYFTYYALRAATAQLQQRTHGTVFDTITRQTFETLDSIFPLPKLTAAFDLAVEPLLEQIRANLHQSCNLTILRDTLLPKLLRGGIAAANLQHPAKSTNKGGSHQ